eukprot:2135041-Prymnesium_polylepis.1
MSRGAVSELFSNSPVWWMCTNHNPSGSTDGASDNLQSWNHKQHAEYLAIVAQHASTQWGVNFQSVEAFNEPISSWWRADGSQEGCHFERSTQATVSRLLRQQLDQRNLSRVLVAASDENTYDEALATWQTFDASTKAAVQQVNTHGYQQGQGRRDLLYNATKGKKLWNSEYGEGDASGRSLASNLNLDFRWCAMQDRTRYPVLAAFCFASCAPSPGFDLQWQVAQHRLGLLAAPGPGRRLGAPHDGC